MYVSIRWIPATTRYSDINCAAFTQVDCENLAITYKYIGKTISHLFLICTVATARNWLNVLAINYPIVLQYLPEALQYESTIPSSKTISYPNLTIMLDKLPNVKVNQLTLYINTVVSFEVVLLQLINKQLHYI